MILVCEGRRRLWAETPTRSAMNAHSRDSSYSIYMIALGGAGSVALMVARIETAHEDADVR